MFLISCAVHLVFRWVLLSVTLATLGDRSCFFFKFLQRTRTLRCELDSTQGLFKVKPGLLGKECVAAMLDLEEKSPPFFGKTTGGQGSSFREVCVGETFECNQARWCGPEIDWAWAFLAPRTNFVVRDCCGGRSPLCLTATLQPPILPL